MNVNPAGSCLTNIHAPIDERSPSSSKPSTWPPLDDWPISVDKDGCVISRFSDHTWNLSLWYGSPLSVAFNDAPKLTRRQKRIDSANAHILRIIAAYRIYGRDAVQRPLTLKSEINDLKPLFAHCTIHGVRADELYRHPLVASEFISSLRGIKGTERILTILYRIWYQRDEIGFHILNEEALKELSLAVSKRESVQHAYIPPRIWTYQNLRLRECIDDFIEHKDRITECFHFCMNAYINNAGSLDAAFEDLPQHWLPFDHKNLSRRISGNVYYGRFRLTAERFGIANLLDKWIGLSDKKGIQALSSYFSMISFVGLAYVVNFSLMRREEGASLRANCLSIERDNLGQGIFLVQGKTTKTQDDDDCCWIVSESTSLAIEAMSVVAKLRISAAGKNPRLNMSDEDRSNPFLQARCYEPWAHGKRLTLSSKSPVQSFCLSLDNYPKLLDPNALRITERDLEIVREINDHLPPNTFAVGKVWPISWHQLRRTGAVNMMSSGLVTESDLCYQLKHLNRMMSRYYANNYRHLQAVLNQQAAGTYISVAYEVLAQKTKKILSDDYISPHGEKRKVQILETIAGKDHSQLIKEAKSGKLSYHETFLGGCSKPGVPCPLGGVSNISNCMGYGSQKPCEWATVDRNKRPIIESLIDVIKDRIDCEADQNILKKALQAQLESACRALEVIDAS